MENFEYLLFLTSVKIFPGSVRKLEELSKDLKTCASKAMISLFFAAVYLIL